MKNFAIQNCNYYFNFGYYYAKVKFGVAEI